MASMIAQRAGVSSVASSRAARPSRASVVAPRAALLTQVRSSPYLSQLLQPCDCMPSLPALMSTVRLAWHACSIMV
jgi:hypothetical protein